VRESALLVAARFQRAEAPDTLETCHHIGATAKSRTAILATYYKNTRVCGCWEVPKTKIIQIVVHIDVYRVDINYIVALNRWQRRLASPTAAEEMARRGPDRVVVASMNGLAVLPGTVSRLQIRRSMVMSGYGE
jgi:hypothetical protein